MKPPLDSAGVVIKMGRNTAAPIRPFHIRPKGAEEEDMATVIKKRGSTVHFPKEIVTNRGTENEHTMTVAYCGMGPRYSFDLNHSDDDDEITCNACRKKLNMKLIPKEKKAAVIHLQSKPGTKRVVCGAMGSNWSRGEDLWKDLNRTETLDDVTCKNCIKDHGFQRRVSDHMLHREWDASKAKKFKAEGAIIHLGSHSSNRMIQKVYGRENYHYSTAHAYLKCSMNLAASLETLVTDNDAWVTCPDCKKLINDERREKRAGEKKFRANRDYLVGVLINAAQRDAEELRMLANAFADGLSEKELVEMANERRGCEL